MFNFTQIKIEHFLREIFFGIAWFHQHKSHATRQIAPFFIGCICAVVAVAVELIVAIQFNQTESVSSDNNGLRTTQKFNKRTLNVTLALTFDAVFYVHPILNNNDGNRLNI